MARFVSVSATLIAFLFAAPTASATLIGDTTDTVRSTVKTVQGVLNDPPVSPAPSAAPPATPAAPATPPVPVRAPTDRPPAPSPADSRPGAAATDGVAAVVKGVVGSVTGAGGETVRQAPASAGSPAPVGGQAPAGHPVSNAGRDEDPAPAEADRRSLGALAGAPEESSRDARRASDIESGNSLAVAPGAVVALQQWMAHVWPGIPLIGSDAGVRSAAGAVGVALLSPVAASAGQLLFAAASATTTAADSSLATPPASAKERYSNLLGMMSTDWKRILYRIVLAVLLTLLAFTVWREFHSALRPRLP